MSWIEKRPNGNYHIVFRLGERKFRRSLRTHNEDVALASCWRLEENLRLVHSGRLVIPDDSDIASFLLSDGKLNGKPSAPKRLNLGDLYSTYEAALPVGAIEAESLRIAAVHMRHVARILGQTRQVREIGHRDLQAYVNRRATEPGKKGSTVSTTTIQKELATFRSIWNWCRRNEYVAQSFPNQGLVFPKTDQRPPFMTWSEIKAHSQNAGHTEPLASELWHSLYLRTDEVATVLAHVKKHARYDFL